MLKNYFQTIHKTYVYKQNHLIFLEQLLVLLELEIPLSMCFKIIGQQANNKHIKILASSIYYDLALGDNLNLILNKHPYFFNSWLCTILSCTRQNQQLKQAIKDYIIYSQKLNKIKQALIQQLIYPFTILLGCVFLLYFYNYQLLPSYKNLLTQFNTTLPHQINLADCWYKLLFFITFLLMICFDKKLKRNLPFIGSITHIYDWYKWFYLMAMGLKSGMTFHQTLLRITALLESKPQQYWHKNLISTLEFGLWDQENLTPPLQVPTNIKPFFIFLKAHCESFCFYAKAASILEENLEQTYRNIQKILPPLILSVLSICCGYIIFLFYQPLVKLSQFV